MALLIITIVTVFTTVFFLLLHDHSTSKRKDPWSSPYSPLKPRSKNTTRSWKKPALSAADKGILGEKAFQLTMKLHLPKCYRALHDVTLYTEQGDTTQIDHIIISRYGVFVIETKARSGWIFGSEKQPNWTQKHYKKTFQFQNPLRQNFKHVKTVEKLISVPSHQIHSVIVFFGDCEFKTELPANVTRRDEYATYIKAFKEPIFTDIEVAWMVSEIENARLPPSTFTDELHLRNLEMRFEPANSHCCPRCGSAMLLRKAKRGLHKGSDFWGCSTYPKCKAIENILEPA